MRLTRAPRSGFTTRVAPAPTGYLHLGHVASALAVWGVAHAFSGRVLLRIEDHDRTRSRPEYETALLEDLAWLGFVPDEAPVRQRERGARYAEALDTLVEKGLVYACACSRKSIEALGGAEAAEVRYPGTCRGRGIDGGRERARRVRLDDVTVGFVDLRLGTVEQTPSLQCGDVLVKDRLGQWTYQFAVTVDDFDQGIDLVIRGEDLLESTGRQIQLSRLLGRETPPEFLHHPLIVQQDGRKLSKSNRDTGIRDLRASGWTVEAVIGRAAATLQIGGGGPMTFEKVVAVLRARHQ